MRLTGFVNAPQQERQGEGNGSRSVTTILRILIRLALIKGHSIFIQRELKFIRKSFVKAPAQTSLNSYELLEELCEI